MTTALQLEPQALRRGRPKKFTPERIQEICDLVERGRVETRSLRSSG